MRASKACTLPVLGAVAALLAPASPAAAATTWYASPAGTDSNACTESDPCSIQNALVTNPSLADGDTVVVGSGTYDIGSGIYMLSSKRVSIEGAPTGPLPRLVGTGWGLLYVPLAGTDAIRISRLEVVAQGSNGRAIEINDDSSAGVTLDNVRGEATADGGVGIFTRGPSYLLRNSVARVAGGGIAIMVLGSPSATSTAIVRNVVADAGRGSHSSGIYVGASGDTLSHTCAPMDVSMKNATLRGSVASNDIVAMGVFGCYATVESVTSNWRDKTTPIEATVTSTNDQHTLDPLFVNASDGDYHEALGSPTIDAGTSDADIGEQDFDGEARIQSAAPDIGADEFSPLPPLPAGGQITASGQAVDVTPPNGSALAFDPVSFAAEKHGASIAAKRRSKHGSTVSYRLSEPSAVTFSVQRKVKGKRKGNKCVTGKRAKRLKSRRCTALKKVRGSFSHSGHVAGNSFHFTGRIGNEALRRGKHRISGIPRDAAGNVGHPFAGNFRIVPWRSR